MLKLWTKIAFVCVVLIGDVFALRVSLELPDFVLEGDDIELQCDYDLGGYILYSVKWYRDDVEFYRFRPSDKPEHHIFPLNGVEVDDLALLNMDTPGRIMPLLHVELATAGTYKCEVSLDAPSFQTLSAQNRLIVIANKTQADDMDGQTGEIDLNLNSSYEQMSAEFDSIQSTTEAIEPEMEKVPLVKKLKIRPNVSLLAVEALIESTKLKDQQVKLETKILQEKYEANMLAIKTEMKYRKEEHDMRIKVLAAELNFYNTLTEQAEEKFDINILL